MTPDAQSIPAAHPSRSIRRDAAIGVGLFCTVLFLYAQVYSHQFIDFDDTSYVTNNPAVSSGLNSRSIAWAFTTFHDGYWLPITWLSYMAVEQISHHNAGLHLIVNALFHAANAVLLWLVLRKLTGKFYQSLGVAMLFAVHPQHVESVAWVAERKDVLFLFFGLLSLGAYGIWAAPRPGEKPRRLAILASVGFYAASLMSKPMLVTMPLILNLLDYWPLERIFRSRNPGETSDGPANPETSMTRKIVGLQLEKLPFYALALASSILSIVGKQASGATQTSRDFPILVRLANAILSYVKYLHHTFGGFNELAIFYPYPRPGEITAAMVVGAIALLSSITLACLWFGRTRKYLLIGWLWFVISLLPVIGLVQVGAQAMADRFVYFPAIGLYLGVVWLLFDGVKRIRPSAGQSWPDMAVGLTAILILWCVSFAQIGYWSNSATVFQHAAQVTRNNDLAEENLGVYLAQHDDIDGALKHFLLAAQISPNFASAHHNAGMAYESKGDFKNAFAQYQAASRSDPNFVDSYFNAGNLFLRLGQPDKARACYLQALKIRPDFQPARAAIDDMATKQINPR